MDIKILYDNEALAGFQKGWGFACLIEIDQYKVLFDTGDGPGFLANLEKFGINPDELQHVILSHPHFDHMGGLLHLLERNLNCTVYIPTFFPIQFKIRLMSACKTRETFGFEQILEHIYVDTAKNHLYEQYCLVDFGEQFLIITGCAHPGLDVILSRAKSIGKPILGVLGGFHGFENLETLKDLSFIAPCHCTSLKTPILKRFPNTGHRCAAGISFHF
jgi:7,8-dihydropterin-6-yl-methyl-4-(beta-D-ribofuranosyl)aminobenzene 5'-phosphate synthase